MENREKIIQLKTILYPCIPDSVLDRIKSEMPGVYEDKDDYKRIVLNMVAIQEDERLELPNRLFEILNLKADDEYAIEILNSNWVVFDSL